MSDPNRLRFLKFPMLKFDCRSLAKFSAICTLLLLKDNQKLPDRIILSIAGEIGSKVEKTCTQFTGKR